MGEQPVTTSMEMRKVYRRPEKDTEFKREISMFLHLKNFNQYLHIIIPYKIHVSPGKYPVSKCVCDVKVHREHFCF